MTSTRSFASRTWGLLSALLLGTVTLSSCDIQGQGGVTGPAGVSMTVVDLKGYKPDSVDISAGTTVTFGWNGTNSRQHNFTFYDQSIVSSPTQLYGTYQWTFANPGVFRFYCTVHGAAAEHGVVVVH
jgi:plastocyanin